MVVMMKRVFVNRLGIWWFLIVPARRLRWRWFATFKSWMGGCVKNIATILDLIVPSLSSSSLASYILIEKIWSFATWLHSAFGDDRFRRWHNKTQGEVWPARGGHLCICANTNTFGLRYNPCRRQREERKDIGKTLTSSRTITDLAWLHPAMDLRRSTPLRPILGRSQFSCKTHVWWLATVWHDSLW